CVCQLCVALGFLLGSLAGALGFLIFVLFFFFQAEDGIRDGHVTGVQTYALPILLVVDDGSSDRTAAQAEAAGARVLRLERNLGKIGRASCREREEGSEGAG